MEEKGKKKWKKPGSQFLVKALKIPPASRSEDANIP